MTSYLTQIPRMQRLPGQVANSAGGYVFAVDWKQSGHRVPLMQSRVMVKASGISFQKRGRNGGVGALELLTAPHRGRHDLRNGARHP